MTELIYKGVLIYLAALNIIAFAVTVYDKSISKLPRGSVRRIPEKFFVRISALGGGVGTLLTMLLVHHKTKSHNGLLAKICFFAFIWIAILMFLIGHF